MQSPAWKCEHQNSNFCVSFIFHESWNFSWWTPGFRRWVGCGHEHSYSNSRIFMPLLHDYNEWSNLNLSYKIFFKKNRLFWFSHYVLSRKWDRALNTSSFSHPIPQLKLVETSWNQFVIAWLNSMPNLNTSVAWASGSNSTCFKHCDWTDSKWLSTDATWRWSRSPSSSFVWCFSFWALWMD